MEELGEEKNQVLFLVLALLTVQGCLNKMPQICRHLQFSSEVLVHWMSPVFLCQKKRFFLGSESAVIRKHITAEMCFS